MIKSKIEKRIEAGIRLKGYLLRYGMSQKELADQMSIKPQRVSKIIHGEAIIRPGEKRQIESFFDITWSDDEPTNN